MVLLFVTTFAVGWLMALAVHVAFAAARTRKLPAPEEESSPDTVPPTRMRVPVNAGPYRAPAERRPEPKVTTHVADPAVEARNALAMQVMRNVLERKLAGEDLVAAMRTLLDAGVTHLEAADALHRVSAQLTVEQANAHLTKVMADTLGIRRRLLN